MRSTVSLRTSVHLCIQHAQSFKEKIPILRISWVCKSSQPRVRKKVNRRVPNTFAYCSISNSMVWLVWPWELFSFILKTNGFFSLDPSSRTLYFALLRMFVRSGFLAAFTVTLGYFCKAKFIWGTSLIFSTVIWSYVTPFLNWQQKGE